LHRWGEIWRGGDDLSTPNFTPVGTGVGRGSKVVNLNEVSEYKRPARHTFCAILRNFSSFSRYLSFSFPSLHHIPFQKIEIFNEAIVPVLQRLGVSVYGF